MAAESPTAGGQSPRPRIKDAPECRWGLQRPHHVRTNRCEWGERQGGHRACRSWARRHELPSCPDDVSGDEARTHAPVRSPDRDGDIDDGDLNDQEVTNEHTRAVRRNANGGAWAGSDPAARTLTKRWMLQRPTFCPGLLTRRGKLYRPAGRHPEFYSLVFFGVA